MTRKRLVALLSRGGRRTLRASGWLLVLAATAAAAYAGNGHGKGPKGVPEIDPGSLASAVTLLVGGVLILTGRTRRS